MLGVNSYTSRTHSHTLAEASYASSHTHRHTPTLQFSCHFTHKGSHCVYPHTVHYTHTQYTRNTHIQYTGYTSHKPIKGTVQNTGQVTTPVTLSYASSVIYKYTHTHTHTQSNTHSHTSHPHTHTLKPSIFSYIVIDCEETRGTDAV